MFLPSATAAGVLGVPTLMMTTLLCLCQTPGVMPMPLLIRARRCTPCERGNCKIRRTKSVRLHQHHMSPKRRLPDPTVNCTACRDGGSRLHLCGLSGPCQQTEKLLGCCGGVLAASAQARQGGPLCGLCSLHWKSQRAEDGGDLRHRDLVGTRAAHREDVERCTRALDR